MRYFLSQNSLNLQQSAHWELEFNRNVGYYLNRHTYTTNKNLIPWGSKQLNINDYASLCVEGCKYTEFFLVITRVSLKEKFLKHKFCSNTRYPSGRLLLLIIMVIIKIKHDNWHVERMKNANSLQNVVSLHNWLKNIKWANFKNLLTACTLWDYSRIKFRIKIKSNIKIMCLEEMWSKHFLIGNI